MNALLSPDVQHLRRDLERALEKARKAEAIWSHLLEDEERRKARKAHPCFMRRARARYWRIAWTYAATGMALGVAVGMLLGAASKVCP